MKTQQEEVYLQLKEAIFRGKFEPGHSVTLRGLAQMLGVSTTPIREAIRRLVSEGALKLLENRRITVPEMSENKLKEIFFSRVQLECFAAEQAFHSITIHGMNELEHINKRHNKAIADYDVENYIYLNFEFHRRFYAHAKLSVISQLIESLWLQTAPFMRMISDQFGQDKGRIKTRDPHAEIIDALRQKQVTRVKHLIHEDILDGIRIQQRLMGWPITS